MASSVFLSRPLGSTLQVLRTTEGGLTNPVPDWGAGVEVLLDQGSDATVAAFGIKAGTKGILGYLDPTSGAFQFSVPDLAGTSYDDPFVIYPAAGGNHHPATCLSDAGNVTIGEPAIAGFGDLQGLLANALIASGDPTPQAAVAFVYVKQFASNDHRWFFLTESGAAVSIGNGLFTGAHAAADGSAGSTTTVTTGSLVGKTMTFKNGLLTGFA